MIQNRIFQKSIALTLILTFTVQLCSCGTLLYPERRGQSGGRIDPSVAILDGIGLLFFIVPGLVAYAIDFSSGAIYLPRGRGAVSPANDADRGVVVVQTAPGGPSKAELQDILEKHTGRKVDLANSPVKTSPLKDVEDFLPKYAQLVESGVLPESSAVSMP